MTPIKTLKDFYKAERKRYIVCWVEWCKDHQQFHPKTVFRFRDDVRHRKMECRLWENEQRRNREKAARQKRYATIEKIRNHPIQQILCSRW